MVADLLAHGLAHAHPHRALHLAFDGQPVQRLAAVVRHPHLVDGDLAGLLVDGHFHHLRGVAVAHGAADGRAAILLAAVQFRDGRVVAGDGDGAVVLQRLGHHLLEGQALVLRARAIDLAQAFDIAGRRVELARGSRDHQRLELVGRIDGRVADQERDARGIGAVVLRHHLAVARDDAHAADVEAHHLGHGLHEDGGGALADVGRAGQHHDGAVEIEFQLDGGVRLAGPVHRLGCARDIVRAGKAQALALAGAGAASLPLRAFQPLFSSTQSMHSGRP